MQAGCTSSIWGGQLERNPCELPVASSKVSGTWRAVTPPDFSWSITGVAFLWEGPSGVSTAHGKGWFGSHQDTSQCPSTSAPQAGNPKPLPLTALLWSKDGSSSASLHVVCDDPLASPGLSGASQIVSVLMAADPLARFGICHPQTEHPCCCPSHRRTSSPCSVLLRKQTPVCAAGGNSPITPPRMDWAQPGSQHSSHMLIPGDCPHLSLHAGLPSCRWCTLNSRLLLKAGKFYSETRKRFVLQGLGTISWDKTGNRWP